ncbi:MAG: fimbrillin family protein [Mediterranea sp.]|nr:fimbrillin family protein [Mediterranea sp.]
MPGGEARSVNGETTETNISEMAVFAYKTQGAWNETTATPNFMYNQKVTKSGGVWGYTPVKYWPSAGSDEKVSFFAVSPAPSGVSGNGITLTTAATATGYPTFTVTPPANPSQQVDFCVAESVMNATEDNTNGKVSFTFNHVMAKVNFEVRYISTGSFGLQLRELTFAGAYASNTLDLSGNAPYYVWGTVSGASATATYDLSVNGGHLVSTPLEKDNYIPVSTASGTLMLVEQTILANKATLEATLWVGKNQVTRPVTPVSIGQEVKLEAGKSYTYQVTIDDSNSYLYNLAQSPWDFDYTGGVQQFVVPTTGTYKLEVWGASGGGGGSGLSNGGKGGYSWGEIALTQGEILYVYVGQAGATSGVMSWNGGPGGVLSTSGTAFSGDGGGGTDFRTVGGNWNNDASLSSRFLVAGGGGGRGGQYGSGSAGGVGGGATGGEGTPNNDEHRGRGGTQTAGGAGGTGSPSLVGPGGFGIGSAGGATDGGFAGGSGGGGWYGGGGADNTGSTGGAGGGGGSGFVSGVTSTSNHTPPPTKTFTAGKGATIAGNASMPNPSGGTMTGRSGNGHAKITLLP